MVVFVHDISEWQRDVNMSTWPAMNVEGVIAKAQEGRDYQDPWWATNKKKIVDHGLVAGGYAYMNHTYSAASQCATFVNRVPGNFIHALDVEAPGPLDVDGWVNEYRKSYPHKILLLYTNEPMWRSRSLVNVTNAATRYAPCAIWIAGAYRGAYQAGTDDFRKIWSRVPAGADGGLPQLGFSKYAVMQYSGSATVPGVAGVGNCDAGVAGGRAILEQLAAENGSDVDMPLTDAEWTKLTGIMKQTITDSIPAIADEVLGRGIQTWDGKRSLAYLASSAYREAKAAAAQTDTVEAALTAVQGLVADDPTLDQITQLLNDKLGSGQGGTLSKADVKTALSETIAQTHFVAQQEPQ